MRGTRKSPSLQQVEQIPPRVGSESLQATHFPLRHHPSFPPVPRVGVIVMSVEKEEEEMKENENEVEEKTREK